MNVQSVSCAAPLTPSSGQRVQTEKASGSSAGMKVTNRVNKCIMKNASCITHNCEIKKVKEKVKKWGYLNNKKQYGWKHSSITRLICNSGTASSGSTIRQTSDDMTGEISDVFGKGGEIKNTVISLDGEEHVGQKEVL